MSDLSQFDVTSAAMRPYSQSAGCFYCKQGVGEKHKLDCVLIKKTVKIRMIVEYDVDVPAHWEKHDIEFHRNDGSWCADNALSELEALASDQGCLCNIARFELVKDSDKHELDE